VPTTPRPSSRDRIREAARRLFPEHGYTGTSVRDIATAAGVDPALVIRYFGSKEGLFLEAMELEFELAPVLDGPLDTLGPRLVRAVLSGADEIRSVYLALLRASEAGDVTSKLRRAHEEDFVGPLRERLDGADADLRARMIAALVGGLLYSAWVVGDEVLVGRDVDDVATRFGALVQELLTPGA